MSKKLQLLNKKFGRLLVIEQVENRNGHTYWLCKCDCNNTVVIQGKDLTRTNRLGTKSCGCLARELISERSRADLLNKKFGRLTVVKDVGNNNQGASIWECVCICGNKTIVVASKLLNGSTKSCGCLARELTIERGLKDLTGQKFNRVTVLEYIGSYKHGGALYKCKCDCGNELITPGKSLTRKHSPTRSCGCYTKDRMSILGKIMWNKNKLGVSKSETIFLDKLAELLNKPIERQYSLRSKLFDGKIDNVLIEVDGEYWHRTKEQKNNDELKNTLAKEEGFELIRIPIRRIEQVEKVISSNPEISRIKQLCSI
jgi:hypothetical protein